MKKKLNARVYLFLVFVTQVTFILFFTIPVFSQEKDSKVLDALESLKTSVGDDWRAVWYDGQKRIKTLRGKLSLPYPGTPEEIAIQFLSENAQVFGLDKELKDTTVKYVKESLTGYHIRFQQSFETLLVFNGGIEVHIGHDNTVFLVQNYYLPDIAISISPALTGEDCLEIAKYDFIKNYRDRKDKTGELQSYQGKTLTFKEVPSAQLGIFEYQGKPYLTYKILLDINKPRALYECIIDANAGRVLQHNNLIQYITTSKDGEGQVFDPNPEKTTGIDLQDNNDADDAAFTPAYFNVPLKDLTGDTRRPGYYTLVGPYVNVDDSVEDPNYFKATKGHVPSKDGKFIFTRSANQFEHVMVYYHIDRNQRYIQSLGFDNINNRSIKVDPHGRNVISSFYVPDGNGTGYIAFGDGGVDDAEDADIILHEYGHAIQDNSAPNKYNNASEARAMGEGFGDYWAASNNGGDPCIVEWGADDSNGVVEVACLRRVDGNKHYPEDIESDKHADGEIWSAALWDLYQKLDKTTTDKLVLQSHFLVPNNPTFGDGAQAILDADDILYNGANKDTICDVMTGRGIVPAECTGAWATTYEGSNQEEAYSTQQTSDGGYVVAGYTYSFGAGGSDLWVLKLRPDGTMEWQKTYGGSGSDYARSIQQTTDGGYIVAGTTESFSGGADFWVLKLDEDGKIKWQKTYGGSDRDYAQSIQQTTDGGYIVAGYTYSFGAGNYSDFWVLKLNPDGAIQWQKRYTYGGASYDYAYSIDQVSIPFDGYIVAGSTYDPILEIWDAMVMLLNTDGTLKWRNTYGKKDKNNLDIGWDGIYSIKSTNGGYVAAGYTTSFGAGYYDCWVLYLTGDEGNFIWQNTYGGSGRDEAYSICQTDDNLDGKADNGFVVAVKTNSFGAGGYDLWLLKLNPDGTNTWQKTYGDFGDDYARSVRQSKEGNYILSGIYHGEDSLVLKTRKDGSIGSKEKPCLFEGYKTGSTAVSDGTITSTTNVGGSDTNATAKDTSATVSDTTAIANTLCTEVSH